MLERGYMAPELLAQGRLTEKVDVYRFGVLVLEIVGGVKNSIYTHTHTHTHIHYLVPGSFIIYCIIIYWLLK